MRAREGGFLLTVQLSCRLGSHVSGRCSMVEQLQQQHKWSWSEHVHLRIPKNEGDEQQARSNQDRAKQQARSESPAVGSDSLSGMKCVCSSSFRRPRWCAGGLQILIFKWADAGATQATVTFRFLPIFETDAGQTVVGQFPMTCAPLATQATAASRLA